MNTRIRPVIGLSFSEVLGHELALPGNRRSRLGMMVLDVVGNSIPIHESTNSDRYELPLEGVPGVRATVWVMPSENRVFGVGLASAQHQLQIGDADSFARIVHDGTPLGLDYGQRLEETRAHIGQIVQQFINTHVQ